MGNGTLALSAWLQVELLSWKSIKDMTGDGGVIKTIQAEGQGWAKPTDKDEALSALPSRHHTCSRSACKPCFTPCVRWLCSCIPSEASPPVVPRIFSRAGCHGLSRAPLPRCSRIPHHTTRAV